MKIVVDKYKCQGHALCAVKAPDVYRLDDDGQNRMGEFEVPPELEEQAELGAACCPEEAILVIK